MQQSQTTDQDPLYPTQVQAAALLAAGHSLDHVCQTLSIGRSTLYRWRQTPDFAAYLNELLRTHADQSLCQSAQLLSLATARIKALLEDPATPPELQLKIAFKIMSLYSRPSYLKMLQSLPDTPDDVIRADFRRNHDNTDPAQMTQDDARVLADHHRKTLRSAEAFDALFPNPLQALDRTRMTQNGTPGATHAAIPSPARIKMNQSGTCSALDQAITAAMAGIQTAAA